MAIGAGSAFRLEDVQMSRELSMIVLQIGEGSRLESQVYPWRRPHLRAQLKKTAMRSASIVKLRTLLMSGTPRVSHSPWRGDLPNDPADGSSMLSDGSSSQTVYETPGIRLV